MPYHDDITPADVQTLARTLGLAIPPDELLEVTYRYGALLEQLGKLDALDLTAADPTAIFPKDAGA